MVETYKDNRSAPPGNCWESRRLTRTAPRQGTRVPRTIRIRKKSQGITVRFTTENQNTFSWKSARREAHLFQTAGQRERTVMDQTESEGVGSRVILETTV